MNIIPLQAIPNQSLTVQIDNISYDIRVHLCSNVMAFDITIAGVLVIQGMRAVSGFPIIPAVYLENGNFVVLTQNDDYPYYDQFGITQFLYYASQAELEAIRGTTIA